MKKIFLIISSSILTIIFIFNIILYYNYNNKLKIINNNIQDYQLKINSINTEELNNKLVYLKEDKKEEIWKYDRWIKWNQEILDKIN